MQNNPTPTSPPPKPQRSKNSPHAAQLAAAQRMENMPQYTQSQRFSLTPQTMDMNIRSPQDQQSSPQATMSHPMGMDSKPYIKSEVQQLETAAEQSNFSMTNPYKRTSGTLSPNLSSFMSMTGMSSAQPVLKSPSQITTNMSPPTTPTNDRQCVDTRSHETSSLQEMPMAYYEQQMQKFRSGSDFLVGDAAKINEELNEIFKKRLRDIDANGQGDNDLKLITYQEWVDMLCKINESMISNMEQLETDVAERLEFLQRRVNSNCRHSQGNELMKCRKDIDTLMKFIQNTCPYDKWDLQGLTFETVTPAQVFGLTEHYMENLNAEDGGGGVGIHMRNVADPESLQRNKLLTHINALAFEVADKHDEIRELKRQVVCLEDEIQKAQKKIQFKEDVIKEMRNDLKRNAKQTSSEACSAMAPINLDTPRSDASTLVSDTTNQFMCPDLDICSQYESLSHNEQVEQEKMKILDDELNQLFKIHKEVNKQQMEKHRKRFLEIFQKSESEKAAAYRKLDFMRRQLIDLETSGVSAVEGDCDSGFGSKNENDQDAKILESVRKRLRDLNERTLELKRHIQKLELENNELSTSLISEKSLSQRNSDILKGIADLLVNMNGEFSYTDIYNNVNSECDKNPFCEEILKIKRTYQDREARFLHTVGLKNQKIEELTQALIESEKVFGQQRRHGLNISEGEDIDNITPPPSLSAQQPPPPPTPQRQRPKLSQQPKLQ